MFVLFAEKNPVTRRWQINKIFHDKPFKVLNKLVLNNNENNEFIDMHSISATQIIFNNLKKKLLESLPLEYLNISKKNNISH